MSRALAILAAVFCVSAFVLPTVVQAQSTYTWADVGPDWATAANWTGSTPPPGGLDVGQFTKATSYNNQPNVGEANSVGAIWQTGAASVNVTGASTLSISGATINPPIPAATPEGIEMDPGAGPLSISAPLVVGTGTGNQFWLNDSSSALTVSGPVTISSGSTLALAAALAGFGGESISGNISGGGAFCVFNPSAGTTNMAVVSGNNSYSGGTTLDGAVQFQGPNALPANSPILMYATIAGQTVHPLFSMRVDGSGNNSTIDFTSNNMVLLGSASFDVGSLSGTQTGNTVAYGVVSDGPAYTNVSFNLRAYSLNGTGYSISFAGLNLSGGNGNSTSLTPMTTRIIITGPVTNPMTNTSPGNDDTLGLQGVTSGNAIYGAISDASGATGNDLNGGGGYTRIIDSDYTGTWILASSANSYSGGTYIGYQNNTPANGGTLQVGTGQAGQDGNLGNTSQVLFNSTNTALSGSGGALVFDIVGSQTGSYPIWGAGSVVKLGGGIQVLCGTNSYTGATTISAGTLQLGTGQSGQDGTLVGINNGTYGSTLVVADSGALVFDIVGSQTASYPISGPGALIMIGPGELVLSSTDNSYGGYSGGTIVESGTVAVTNNEEFADGSSLTVGNPSLIAEFAPLMPAAADRSGAGAQATAVPEPGAAALAAAGGLLLALCRECRRRRWGRPARGSNRRN
jgi:autotransporter-associated beta strand protein